MDRINTNSIKRIFRQGLKQKNTIVRNRRKREYDNKVEQFSKEPSFPKQWYSPSSKSSVKPFKPQPKQLSEGYGFPRPLGEIVQDYKIWEELEEIIRELEEGCD
mgnify:CR=1 FL=1